MHQNDKVSHVHTIENSAVKMKEHQLIDNCSTTHPPVRE